MQAGKILDPMVTLFQLRSPATKTLWTAFTEVVSDRLYRIYKYFTLNSLFVSFLLQPRKLYNQKKLGIRQST